MNAAQIADQAIAKMDAEEAGLIPPAGDDDKNKGTDDNKGGDDDKADKGDDKGAADDSKGKSTDSDDDSKKSDSKDDDKPGEFTGEDALEVDDKPAAAADTKPTDNAGIQLAPAEQKYIADNIGEPIVIRGYQGTGDDRKVVDIKAYSPMDLPADFAFANDRDRELARSGFYNLEKKANDLLGEYRNNASRQATSDFEKRENESIQSDLIALQKDGRFPKFKVRPGSDGFETDPAAVQMQEVLDLMTSRNEKYLKDYNNGRAYKHIGFEEAFELWEAKNPGKQAERKADNDQKREDKERKNTAEHSQSNKGMSTSNIVKPTVRPGTSTRDILARIDADDSL